MCVFLQRCCDYIKGKPTGIPCNSRCRKCFHRWCRLVCSRLCHRKHRRKLVQRAAGKDLVVAASAEGLGAVQGGVLLGVAACLLVFEYVLVGVVERHFGAGERLLCRQVLVLGGSRTCDRLEHLPQTEVLCLHYHLGGLGEILSWYVWVGPVI